MNFKFLKLDWKQAEKTLRIIEVLQKEIQRVGSREPKAVAKRKDENAAAEKIRQPKRGRDGRGVWGEFCRA